MLSSNDKATGRYRASMIGFEEDNLFALVLSHNFKNCISSMHMSDCTLYLCLQFDNLLSGSPQRTLISSEIFI